MFVLLLIKKLKKGCKQVVAEDLCVTSIVYKMQRFRWKMQEIWMDVILRLRYFKQLLHHIMKSPPYPLYVSFCWLMLITFWTFWVGENGLRGLFEFLSEQWSWRNFNFRSSNLWIRKCLFPFGRQDVGLMVVIKLSWVIVLWASLP